MEVKLNNVVKLKGQITSEGMLSHELYGERFYQFPVSIQRQSGVLDILPIIVSERLVNPNTITVNSMVSISGQFRSFNDHKEGNRNKLVLSVFVREIEFIEEEKEDYNNNEITIEGYICKKPIYRQTPNGREIADILLAVNRPYGKSDYIPCITWGRNARFTETLEIGTCIKIIGRVQSREFSKVIDGETVETRIAYEVSVAKIEKIEEE